MKHFLILLLTISISSQAQFKGMFGKNTVWNSENYDKQRYHFGYMLGFNMLDFKTEYNKLDQDILVKTGIGFNVGLVANLRLNESFNLRFEPALCFNQRDLSYAGFTNRFDAIREVRTTYLYYPLLLKYSSKRIGNVRPYLLGGAAIAQNLSSNSKNLEDNKNNVFRTLKWTSFYEVGIGVDLYLEYFKFSPSLRGIFSMNDELIRDKDPNSPWTSNIANMQTRGVFVNFTFH